MEKLRIHYFQHLPFEGLGYIENWISQKGHVLSCTKFYEKHQLPLLEEVDWLIIMGASMNIYEEDKFPWLKQEKEFIRKAIQKNKTVIGICFGSQLIADVLGSKVFKNKFNEIGWFKVTKANNEASLLNDISDSFKAFHWHGDTYDLPEGASHLFQSEACKHQAYLFKNKVLGLQFHLEVTDAWLEGMIKHCKSELTSDIYVQTEEEILASKDLINKSNQLLIQILDNISLQK